MKRVVLSYGECTSPHLPRAVDIRVAYSVSNSPDFWRVSLRVERACSISNFVAYVRNSQFTAAAQLAIPWDLRCSPFWDSYASLAGGDSRLGRAIRAIASVILALSKFSLHRARKLMTLIGSTPLKLYSPMTTRNYCTLLRVVAKTR